MNYLIDTSVFLWSRSAESKLNDKAQHILVSASSTLWFSAASSWEIAIKYRLGSLRLSKEPAKFLATAMRTWGIRSLDMSHAHALLAGSLPLHHRDPFDRMLVAQAQLEGMVLLTSDLIFKRYEVEAVFCAR